MATIDPTIYPSAYHISIQNLDETITDLDFSHDVATLNTNGVLPFDNYMDLSNAYCGFDPNLKNKMVGAVNLTCVTADPENILHCYTEKTQYTNQINYRWMLKSHNSDSAGSLPLGFRLMRYTNNRSPITELTHGNYIQYYNVSGQNSLSFISEGIYSMTTRQYPITKINSDLIVIMPYFYIIEFSFSYTDGVITGYSETSKTNRSYLDIKPEDKTPAGQYYDEDLWTKGFKDTVENGVVTKRTFCTFAQCIVRYGKSNRISLNVKNFSSNDCNADGNRVIPSDGYNYYSIVPMSEIVDSKTNSVIYGDIPGLIFGGASGAQLYQSSSWNFSYRTINLQNIYYDYPINTMTIPTNSGSQAPYILVDNDSSDLTNSFSFYIARSYNFDIDATDIISTTNKYFLNSDGSIYRCVISGSNRYIYAISSCFPIVDLMSTIASLGTFIAGDISTSINDDITTGTFTTSMYHGNIDENGITDGTWIQGDDIGDLPKFEDIDYDPPAPGGGGDEDDEESGDKIPNQTRGFTGAANFITQYALTGQQVATFGAGLWTSWTDGQGLLTDMWKNFKLLWNDQTFNGSLDISTAIDFIVSLRLFPFDLSQFVGTSENSIKMGTGVFPIDVANVWKLLSTVVYVDCGTVTVPRVFNDFRDYENMNITAYMPYCGTVELNPGDVIGRTLRCMYAVDLQSGQCLAVIENNYNGEMLYNIASISGSMGAVIPVTATNAGQITAQKINDAVGVAGLLGGMFMQNISRGGNSFNGELISSVTRYGYGMVNDNLSGALAGISGAVDRFNRGAVSCPSLSGGTGIASFFSADTPFIQMRYGIYSNPTNYKHSVGQVNTSSDTLGSFSGYTVCENPDVSSLSCTDDEKALIRSALQSGVFV